MVRNSRASGGRSCRRFTPPLSAVVGWTGRSTRCSSRTSSMPGGSPLSRRSEAVGMTKVIGVDAAAGEWLAVLLVDGLFAGADLQPSVDALRDRHPEVEVVAVDIPIGL